MKMIVLRRALINVRQDQLVTLAENVVQRTASVAAYQPLAAALAELAARIPTYKEALAAARDRGLTAIAIKNQARAALLAALDAVADGLDLNAGGDPLYVLNAGMPVRAQRRRNAGEMAPPAGLQARPTGQPGEVLVSFRLPNRAAVQSNAVEHSVDGGQTWKNGAYNSATRFVVSKLPSRQEILLRVRSMGARGRESAWTAPVTVFVP